MNIGSVIMNKRKALGYTQQALADKLNVSFQAISISRKCIRGSEIAE